ncbi:hypothetical protein FJTKL_07410 [Diaporthe vaccinii]|uniref:Uncharacterized protein n=1 Tax=Diaporthe vaccinii TaxID=105482 RepID=A0ABR4EU05_9PEZI
MPPIDPTSIPNITFLRQQLGYGDPQRPEYEAFCDSVRVFRKTFTSSSGHEGISFYDWKSKEHQSALEEMVQAYLKREDGSESSKMLMCSTNHARIIEIMKQLFWRLNIQQYRNSKYKKKRSRRRLDQSVVGATGSPRATGSSANPKSSTSPNLTASHAASTTAISSASHDAPSYQTRFAIARTGAGDGPCQVAPYTDMKLSARTLSEEGTSTRLVSSKWSAKRPPCLGASRVCRRQRESRHLSRSPMTVQLPAAQSLQSDSNSEVVKSAISTEMNNKVTFKTFPGGTLVDEGNKDATPAPPAGQARVDFLYRVVSGDVYPELRSSFWEPEGSFRNKTLAELEEELPIYLERSQFQHFFFQLTAPNTRAEHFVSRGREDQFDALKRYFADLIANRIAKTPCDQTLLVEIDIELLVDVGSVRKRRTHKELTDFDW